MHCFLCSFSLGFSFPFLKYQYTVGEQFGVVSWYSLKWLPMFISLHDTLIYFRKGKEKFSCTRTLKPFLTCPYYVLQSRPPSILLYSFASVGQQNKSYSRFHGKQSPALLPITHFRNDKRIKSFNSPLNSGMSILLPLLL